MVLRILSIAQVLIAFVLCSIVVGAIPVTAQQGDKLYDLHKEAEQLSRAGRYAEAADIAQRVLALGEDRYGPDDVIVGTLLINLAWLYAAEARYTEAEPLYKRALAIRENAFGPDDPDVGDCLIGLAALYQKQGRHAEAEPLYTRALAISEKALGPARSRIVVAAATRALSDFPVVAILTRASIATILCLPLVCG
jgi:tetratricopeptide (TPR) repeat protein